MVSGEKELISDSPKMIYCPNIHKKNTKQRYSSQSGHERSSEITDSTKISIANRKVSAAHNIIIKQAKDEQYRETTIEFNETSKKKRKNRLLTEITTIQKKTMIRTSADGFKAKPTKRRKNEALAEMYS